MDIKRMIAVVQCYIHHKKNVEVNISINSPSDMYKLIQAYNVANKYFA